MFGDIEGDNGALRDHVAWKAGMYLYKRCRIATSRCKTDTSSRTRHKSANWDSSGSRIVDKYTWVGEGLYHLHIGWAKICTYFLSSSKFRVLVRDATREETMLRLFCVLV